MRRQSRPISSGHQPGPLTDTGHALPRTFYPQGADSESAAATASQDARKPGASICSCRNANANAPQTAPSPAPTGSQYLDRWRHRRSQTRADTLCADVHRTRVRLHAVWPGSTAVAVTSAVPIDIAPGATPLSVRLTLTQPGNSFLDDPRQPVGATRCDPSSHPSGASLLSGRRGLFCGLQHELRDLVQFLGVQVAHRWHGRVLRAVLRALLARRLGPRHDAGRIVVVQRLDLRQRRRIR